LKKTKNLFNLNGVLMCSKTLQCMYQ